MPANEQAAAVTDNYRAWLIGLVSALRRRVGADLADLDMSSVDTWLRAWLADYVPVVTAGMVAASAQALAYLEGYALASGITDLQLGAVSSQVDTNAVYTGIDSVRVGALWRLGRGDGQAAARITALALADKVTATVIYDHARAVQHDAMQGDERITGYARVTTTRPCGACLALAGRIERKADVVDRHDRCSCTGEPVFAGVGERLKRATGQDLVDRLSNDELAKLFERSGGARKAQAVRSQGVDALVGHTGGQLVEQPLQNIDGS